MQFIEKNLTYKGQVILEKQSLNQLIIKENSCEKNSEVAGSEKLFQTVLYALSKNKTTQQKLAAVSKSSLNNNERCVPQEAIDKLVNLYNKKEYSTVINHAQSIIKQYSDSFIVWNILGASFAQIGILDDALEAYQTAICLNENYAEAHLNIGVIFKEQRKFNEAINSYKISLHLKPDNPEAYVNIGVVLKVQGKLDKAIEAYEKAISLRPDFAVAYNNLGNVLKDKKNLDDAIVKYKKAISLKPDYAQAYVNMGNTFQEQIKLDLSIEAYKKAISLKPDFAEAYNSMGNALKFQKKFSEAKTAFNKALSLKPDHINFQINIGDTFKDEGDIEQAIITYQNVLLSEPNFAEVHQSLSFALLNSGRIKEGLEEYEWRWKIPNFVPFRRNFIKPSWDGKNNLKDKRIFLWNEKGIGDTLNWSSVLLKISKQAKHCIFECQEKLLPLLKRSFPEVEIKAEKRSMDLKRNDFDFHLPMGSLYKHFIQEISEGPKQKKFLIPDPDRVVFWRERLYSLGKGPFIGISWKSSNISLLRHHYYTDISDWAPILKIPDITFINLQYSDFDEDLARVRDELGVTVHNFDDLDQYNNIDELAALTAALDIVISIKNLVPIISTGVGTKTKILCWKQSNLNNVLFNPTTSNYKMYYKSSTETWKNAFNLITDDLFKLNNKKHN